VQIRPARVVRGAGVGADLRALRPAQTRPPDFFDFWADTLSQLDQEDPDVRREPVERSGPASRDVAQSAVSFRSLGGARIHGYGLVHTDDRPRPLVVHAHGYNSFTEVQRGWADAGCHVLGFDVRGFGRSTAAVPNVSPRGWVVTGAESPHTSVLRGAVCDYVRAVGVARPLVEGQAGVVSRVVAHGVSFAGGLAVLAQGQRPTADLLAVGVPTFGWFEGRRSLRPGGSAAELNEFLDTCSPEAERRVTGTMAYFDAVNSADLVRAAVLVGVGCVDPIVPPETVYAVINHLRVAHEIWELPVSHSEAPEEALWDDFERRWLQLALGPEEP
jgi:cephalosporin-C deacetylase-like acetyl esterase